MAEAVHGSGIAMPQSSIPGLAAPVEPLTRQGTDKENQARDSSHSAVASRTPAKGESPALEGNTTNAPVAARPIHKQTSLAVAAPASPSRFHSTHFHEGDNSGGHPASIKRGPIRVGYLFKQSSGSWKRKRWNQRWFVLDNETGILKYFRHESLPEAVPFRQDAHGVIHLKEPGASLVIQGDLPRNVPTPFCFTVCDASRSFLICADTNQEFREWTSAISAILSPRKTSTVDGASPPSVSKRSVTDSALDAAVSLARAVPPIVTSEALLAPKPLSSKTPFIAYEDVKPDVRPTVRQTLLGLLVINAFFAIVRYGSVEWMYVSLLGMNVYLVWMLWIRKPPPLSAKGHHFLDNERQFMGADDPATDSDRSLSGAGSSPRANSGGVSPRSSDSPRKPTLPRIEKIPSSSFQPTKLLGVVNGVKAKAGDSVKMCPPAPAAFVAGCWTQISGTRYQVRQGPNYRKTKIKAPSEESLLDLVAVDIFRSPTKIDNIASIIDLGDLKPENGPLDLFIVNCQVPSYQPSNPLWGEKQGNGEGFNFVSFFAIPPEIREQLNQHEPSQQAVRLLKNFMLDNSSVRDRFKAIGIVVNPQEQKLGRTERHLLETYNGQPILTRPQHRFYRGDGYFEVDVDAHEFNFVARKGLVGVSEHFRNMVVDFGYVLEGQEDAELPEQMLGAVRLCKIDVRQALEIS